METFFQAAAKMVSSPLLSQQPMQLTFKWPNLLDCYLKRKRTQTQAVFLKSWIALLMHKQTVTLNYERCRKEAVQKGALLAMSPLISPNLNSFLQIEEGTRQRCETERQEYCCFMSSVPFWYRPAVYIRYSSVGY